MAEKVGWPATACGEGLRQLASNRMTRQRRTRIAFLGAAACAPCLLALVFAPPTLLVWNVSASAPRGLYRVEPWAKVRRGDFVVARLGPAPASIAARRNYLPVGVPLVKRVAAARGDRVCAAGAIVRINGRREIVRRRADRLSRELPWWNGCRRLGRDEIFLLGDHSSSFDSRYFGPLGTRMVLGRAVPLWRR